MRCETHKRYKGMLRPRILCEDCWRLYIRNQDSKGWRNWARQELKRIPRKLDDISGVAGGSPDRKMAEQSTILRALVGSTVHGLALEGTDDRDEMGVCLEPMEAVCGFSEFEQFIYRTAAEREGKHDAPSAPGDLDLTIYSLRKYLRLAMQGNPTVLTLLFTRGDANVYCDARGSQLQDLAPKIVSRQAGKRYLGYLESQRQRLMGERGQKKVNRPELEEKYGYDTKYAMHMLRLGFQGVQLLTTGQLTLPMGEPERGWLLGVRRGEVPLQDVLQRTGELERELKDLISDGPIREYPDKESVEAWMLGMYWEKWKCDRFREDRLDFSQPVPPDPNHVVSSPKIWDNTVWGKHG